MKCGHSIYDMALLEKKCGWNARNAQKQYTNLLRYIECVQNFAIILVKMYLVFPLVLLYHKNNERER